MADPQAPREATVVPTTGLRRYSHAATPESAAVEDLDRDGGREEIIEPPLGEYMIRHPAQPRQCVECRSCHTGILREACSQ